MANRSYLYATDHLPGSAAWEEKKDLRSIAEWRYDIPFVFKILLSGNPAPVRSSIWDTPQLIAVAADAKAGLARLERFLALLPPEAKVLVDETREFFSDPRNVRKHFILEAGEIFELMDKDLGVQNRDLVAEIASITDDSLRLEVPAPLSAVAAKLPLIRRLLLKMSRTRPVDPLMPFYDVGLGGWSSVLYFQFEADEADKSTSS